MRPPDYSSFKDDFIGAWKQVFARLDKIESENINLKARVAKLEEERGK